MTFRIITAAQPSGDGREGVREGVREGGCTSAKGSVCLIVGKPNFAPPSGQLSPQHLNGVKLSGGLLSSSKPSGVALNAALGIGRLIGAKFDEKGKVIGGKPSGGRRNGALSSRKPIGGFPGSVKPSDGRLNGALSSRKLIGGFPGSVKLIGCTLGGILCSGKFGFGKRNGAQGVVSSRVVHSKSALGEKYYIFLF
jgi:hypothetical protein